MKKIRKIDILGVKHTIRYHRTLEDGGYYSTDKPLIDINNEVITDEEKYLKTIIHECGHGVLYLNGVHQDITLAQEHAIIDSMITFLFTNFDIKLKTKRGKKK